VASPEKAYDVTAILAHTATQAPTLGAARLICVDGPAGSGKSTLARSLQARSPGAVLLETDEMLEGWGGLSGLAVSLLRVVAPIAHGVPGRWRRWDWHADGWAEWHHVPDTNLLLVEGVGSGTPLLDPWRTTLVWVEAPSSTRLDRGIERDGESMRSHWLRWRPEEDALHARERTRLRADFQVDGETGEVHRTLG
jgi:hypothetical protein